MTRSIVVLDGYTLTAAKLGQPAQTGEPQWQALAKLGTLVVHDRTASDKVLETIGDADIVLTNKTPITADTLRNAPNLKYVGVMATGVNVVDIQAAAEQNIIVTNAPGYSTDSVAQHVFALTLELASRVAAHDHAVHDGQWISCPDFCFTVAPLTELAGKTLGIVGLGSIGKRVATIGHAFGMRIAASHQRSMNEVELPGIEIDWLTLDDLIEQADVLTLHCPLTEQTQNMINASRLSKMKSSAILINTGRGPLIDEQALADALQAGEIAGAGLDVLSQEPPTGDNPLLNAPNCIITPHIAWASREARCRLMQIITDNVTAFIQGNPVHVV